MGAVNCDEEKSLCQEYGIQGFPTIKWFGKDKKRPELYEDRRTAAAIEEYGLAQWAKNVPPPEVWKADPSLLSSAPQRLCLHNRCRRTH